MLGLYSPVSNYSLLSLLKKEPFTAPGQTSTPRSGAGKKQVPCRKIRRGQRVVVRSDEDGFYYPGK